MIKSTRENSQPLRKFPRLMMQDFTKTVVLFTENQRGIVVSKGDGVCLGFYSHCWDMEKFSDFNGSIKLENKL